MTENTTQQYSKDLKFYKPKKNGDGAASGISISKKNEVMCFWTFAKQIPSNDNNARFSWTNNDKIIFKISDVDAAKILAFINSDVKKIDIYHQTKVTTTILQISRMEKPENWVGVYISQTNNSNKSKKAIKHLLSLTEIELLKIFLRGFIKLYYQIP